MKIFVFAFAFLLVVVQIMAQSTSPRPGAAGAPDRAPDKIDCNSAPKDITCSIAQTKRVYYDPKTKECKLLAKGTCAGSPSNQFTTISACKHKCIIPAQKSSTPKA